MTGTDHTGTGDGPRVWTMPDWRTRTCRCGHVGDAHDAGECWASVSDPGDPEFASQCPCSWLEFTDATEAAQHADRRRAVSATLKIIVTDAETGEHPDWWSGWDFKLITAVDALDDAGQDPAVPRGADTHNSPQDAQGTDEFNGWPDRECGEHHTTGSRAWCPVDSEWCSQEAPCRGCELPQLRAELERLRAVDCGHDLHAFERQAAELAAEKALVGRLAQERDEARARYAAWQHDLVADRDRLADTVRRVRASLAAHEDCNRSQCSIVDELYVVLDDDGRYPAAAVDALDDAGQDPPRTRHGDGPDGAYHAPADGVGETSWMGARVVVDERLPPGTLLAIGQPKDASEEPDPARRWDGRVAMLRDGAGETEERDG